MNGRKTLHRLIDWSLTACAFALVLYATIVMRPAPAEPPQGPAQAITVAAPAPR